MKFLKEDYYNIDNKRFFDYGTEDIKRWIRPNELPYSSEIFDKSTLGGYSNYDQYMKPENITMMTPREYFERTAEGFNSTFYNQVNQVENDKEAINHLNDVLFIAKKKFPMAYISKSNGAKQEGRHRLYVAAQLFGWDKPFPVLLIP